MPSAQPDYDRRKHQLDVALETRQFEIGLLWQRSLFFWGFIAPAFGALAWAYGTHSRLSLAVTSFGLVCSSVWTFANRGSRFWQVSWEAKVQQAEDDVIGPIFKTPIGKSSNRLWNGKRYSVSRLVIALSDYVVLMWSSLLAYQLALMAFPKQSAGIGTYLTIGFVVISVLYILLVRRETSLHGDA